jgi:ligand-binding SRPBCC domain-containing protein
MFRAPMMHVLEHEQVLPIPLEEAWDFFSSPRNLDAITPPDLGFRIESCRSERMHEGQIITYKVKVAPGIWVPWVTEIKAVDEGRAFVDEQRFGPYKFWHHRHSFEAVEGGVRMGDLVHYALPFGPIGGMAHALFVRRKVEWIFRFRREVLAQRFGG